MRLLEHAPSVPAASLWSSGRGNGRQMTAGERHGDQSHSDRDLTSEEKRRLALRGLGFARAKENV